MYCFAVGQDNTYLRVLFNIVILIRSYLPLTILNCQSDLKYTYLEPLCMAKFTLNCIISIPVSWVFCYLCVFNISGCGLSHTDEWRCTCRIQINLCDCVSCCALSSDPGYTSTTSVLVYSCFFFSFCFLFLEVIFGLLFVDCSLLVLS